MICFLKVSTLETSLKLFYVDIACFPKTEINKWFQQKATCKGNMIFKNFLFILQNGDENPKTQDPVDISKLSENISRSTCEALVKYLDLLTTNNFTKVGIRVTLHSENVSYEAGSNGIKFAPIYMNSLDNALIPVLHNITSKNLGNNDPIILELIFHILNS